MAISLQQFWARLNLSQKIVFPFLAACLSVLLLGLFTVGNWFIESLEQNLHQEIQSFTERASQDFLYEEQALENQAKLIVDREDLRRAVESQDRGELLKILLPLRTTLDLDWVKIVSLQGNTLFEARVSALGNAKLLDNSITSVASRGGIFTDLVDVEGGQQTLQAIVHPIKSASGLLGGIIIAQLIDDELLEKFAAGSSKHLVVVRNGRIIATTLSSIHDTPALTSLEPTNTQFTINQQRYLARSISLTQASQSFFTIVLYPIARLDQEKRLLWLRFGLVFLLEGVIVAIVGVLIAQAITYPLKVVSQVAKKVTQNSDFSLQAPVLSQDEVGVVAFSFNQLMQRVQQLLITQEESKQQLEIYSQTLEKQVQNRTTELKQKNINLNQTLQKLRNTQLQLIQGEKMAAMGQLVAGLAHEINNPVNFIHGNIAHLQNHAQDLLDLLDAYQDYYPQPPPALKNDLEEVDLDFLRKDLGKILESMKIGSDRIRDLVLSLRNFSRLDESSLKSVNVHEGLESSLLILQHRLKARPNLPEIEVIKAYGKIPLLECYPSQLNQVFMNIISNAIDALEERDSHLTLAEYQQNPSQIRIHTTLIGSLEVDSLEIDSLEIDSLEIDSLEIDSLEIDSLEYPNNSVSPQVQITISDNGVGIPKAVQQKIFDPFFTTKEIGKGTGLGMSISYQIITERHNGYLICESQPGEGTNFIIKIPLRQR